ncbi:MAG: transglycosylase [Acidobacteria bacterium]|nr:MAG: transglycosylase [Acidobacteriota bacterium]
MLGETLPRAAWRGMGLFIVSLLPFQTAAEPLCVARGHSGAPVFSNLPDDGACSPLSLHGAPDARDPVASSARSRSSRPFERSVAVQARRYGVSQKLVHAVIQAESGGNPAAVSPKGAQGIMQLMPATARRFEVSDPLDPDQNIEGGVRYLSYLLDIYNGDTVRALAAYNAGEAAVRKHGGVPPYRETQDYVHKVLELAGNGPSRVRTTREGPTIPTAPAASVVRMLRGPGGTLRLEN